jgi:general secretion pathway protein K
MTYNKLKQQKGTALINALLIVIFIASTITLWLKQTKFHVYQEHVMSESQQALELQEVANLWGAQTLKTKNFHQTTAEITCMDPKLISLPPNWKMTVKLIDAQSTFNINSLSERPMQLTFLMLLKNVLKNISNEQLKTIFMGTLASIDESAAPAKRNELNQFYAQQTPPYQVNGQAFASISEWKKVKGVTSRIYKAMYPYLYALPESTPININTANKTMLLSLRPKLKDADVKKLIFARGESGFRNAGELFAILQELKLPVQNTTIHSQYFWVDTDILCPSKRHIKIKTLFYRRLTPKGTESHIILLKHFRLA